MRIPSLGRMILNVRSWIPKQISLLGLFFVATWLVTRPLTWLPKWTLAPAIGDAIPNYFSKRMDENQARIVDAIHSEFVKEGEEAVHVQQVAAQKQVSIGREAKAIATHVTAEHQAKNANVMAELESKHALRTAGLEHADKVTKKKTANVGEVTKKAAALRDSASTLTSAVDNSGIRSTLTDVRTANSQESRVSAQANAVVDEFSSPIND